MKHAFLIAALMIFSCQFAYAEDQTRERNWYVQGLLGVSILNDSDVGRTVTVTPPGFTGFNPHHMEWQNGPAYQLNIGYQRMAPVSFEIELSHTVNKLDRFINDRNGALVHNGSSISATNVMFNALYELNNTWAVKPFIGAGIGASRITFAVSDTIGYGEHAKWTLALQPIAGMKWNVYRDFDLVALYKFVWAPDPDVSTITSRFATTETYHLSEYSAHSFLFGVRYNF